MECEAISHLTGSMVYLDDRAGSFTIDMKIRARARLLNNDRIQIKYPRNREILKRISKNVLKFLGYDGGIEVWVKPELRGIEFPIESICSALTIAIAGAISTKNGSVNILRIDKYLMEQFIEIDGGVVNKIDLVRICAKYAMRFDMLCSSMFGGFFLCDNKNHEIMRRGEMEKLHAILLERKNLIRDTESIRNELEIIWDEALKGNLYTAMRLNARIFCDKKFVDNLIKSGALTVTVSENFIIALARGEEIIKNLNRGIRTRITNEPTKVLINPRKILKMREFMKMDGARGYYFI